MKHRLKVAAFDAWLIGATAGYTVVRWFDRKVEKRARDLLRNPVWEAERITRDASKEKP